MATSRDEDNTGQAFSHELSDGKEVTTNFIDALEKFVDACHDSPFGSSTRKIAKTQLFRVMMGQS